MFSSSRKPEHWYDVPLAYSEGTELYRRLEEKSIEVYEAASFHASSKGMILTDTKFESGWVDDALTLEAGKRLASV